MKDEVRDMGDNLRHASNVYSLKVAPLDAHIGRQVAARRIDLGLTEAQLATALRLPAFKIAAYESGTQHIEPEELIDLAQVLGVSLGYFYAEPTFPPQDRQIYAEYPAGDWPAIAFGQRNTEQRLRDEVRHLGESFARIRDSEIRGSVIQFVDSLAAERALRVAAGEIPTGRAASAFERLAELEPDRPSAS